MLDRLISMGKRWPVVSGILAISVLIGVLWLIQPARWGVWSPRIIDAVVLTVALLGISVAVWGYKWANNQVSRRKRLIDSATIFVLVLSVVAAYAAFRNQSRLLADQILSDEGQIISDYEMEAGDDLRCIYDNFAYNDVDACLRQITSRKETWSRLVFYVEAIWWILEKSRADERSWGSNYSVDIDYWREYIEDDHTGMFSYYIVAFHEGEQQAVEAMERAGVTIPDFVAKYCRVYSALALHGARPPRTLECPQAAAIDALLETSRTLALRR